METENVIVVPTDFNASQHTVTEPTQKELKKRRVVSKRKMESQCDVNNEQLESSNKSVLIPSEDIMNKLRDYTISDEDSLKRELSVMTIPLLKMVCKEFKLKVMGKKADLVERIVRNHSCMVAGSFLQDKVKRAIARRWLKLHGPALFDKSSCVNDMDLMGADIADLPMDQMFSFADNGFVYAFDIATFGSLIVKNYQKDKIKNPYTRDDIQYDVFSDFKNLILYSALLKRKFYTVHPDETTNGGDSQVNTTTTVANNTITITHSVQNGVVNVEVDMTTEEIDDELRSLFYVVDSYGYYTNPDWVINMSSGQLRGFLRDMMEIFNFRANLTHNAMTRIINPTGILERNSNGFRQWLRVTFDEDVLKRKVCEFMKKLVMTGVEQGDRDLGTLYVLTALTLNSPDAASAMPWLYESAM